MPALQVVSGILTTLGNKHVTATKQVIRYFSRVFLGLIRGTGFRVSLKSRIHDRHTLKK